MFLLKFVYFLLFGWWLGALAAVVGYVLCLTIIGLPFGTLILNRLPTIMYFKETGEDCGYCPEGHHERESVPFILRVVWFFLLGWELGGIFLIVGYVLMVTVVGLPLGVYVLNRLPLVLTLSRRYD